MKSILTFIATFAVATTAFSEDVKPALPQFVADILQSNTVRGTLSNIRIEDDGKMVTRQFRNSVIRNTSWTYDKHGEAMAPWFDTAFNRIVSANDLSLTLEEQAQHAEFKSDPQKLIKTNVVKIGEKRVRISLRVPFTTPHKCGQEDHNVWLTAILDYSGTPPAAEEISPSLLTMMDRDGLHYFHMQAEEDEYCAKVTAEEEAKKDAMRAAEIAADKAQDIKQTAPDAADAGKAKAE
jgi:hypothetical protein